LSANHALKVLEQEAILGITEHVFLPATIQVIAEPETVRSVEYLYPDLDPVLKCLLRTYAGIYDHIVGISEKNIAFLLQKEPDQVYRSLYKLHALEIIAYTPQKDKPQLYFLQSRVKAERLYINEKRQADRKEIFRNRITAITNYVLEMRKCRSVQIGNYFGDIELQACGKCDNCLAQKSEPLNTEEFESIHRRILLQIEPGPLPSGELLEKLGNIKKEKAWEVLLYLEAENKIVVNKEGAISLKNT
jgi:ATP-dependent DNA helicase RecQ